MLVEGCHLSSSCNAIRIGVGEGHIHDAVIRDIEITDCNTAFNFVCSYSGERGTDIDAILLQDIWKVILPVRKQPTRPFCEANSPSRRCRLTASTPCRAKCTLWTAC